MAPAEEPSNIRVFVHWHDQTVFAGEEVKCTITFKNVATDGDQKEEAQEQKESDRHRLTSALQARAKATANLSTSSSATISKGHRRSALSLSGPPSSIHSRTGSVQWVGPGDPADGRSGHSHKRSVSIVSIGSANTVDEYKPKSDAPPRSQRPGRGHNRATSLQILPRGQSSPISSHSGKSDSPKLARSAHLPGARSLRQPTNEFSLFQRIVSPGSIRPYGRCSSWSWRTPSVTANLTKPDA